MRDRIGELAREHVDTMAALGGRCDFVTDVALDFPLYVIMSLLGLPESDLPRMLRLTKELFGGGGEDNRRSASAEEQMAVLMDFLAYFQRLTAARRADPTDDMASTIANATVDGAVLCDLDAASYYVLIATAGHDTTSSTISGGLHALLQYPDQLARLRQGPSLMATAAEEMIRWIPLGQPGRGGLRQPVHVQRRPRPEQAPGVRVRQAFLPGRGPGPDGDPGAVR